MPIEYEITVMETSTACYIGNQFLVYLSLPYKDIQLILHDEWMF